MGIFVGLQLDLDWRHVHESPMDFTGKLDFPRPGPAGELRLGSATASRKPSQLPFLAGANHDRGQHGRAYRNATSDEAPNPGHNGEQDGE
jgi:hypothetical protein